MAQKKFDYQGAWEKIEEKESEGLFKSLLPSVNKIYDRAKKDKNTPQLIKALIYQSKIALETDEDLDIDLEVFKNFRKEISEADPVSKSVLESLLAELYLVQYTKDNWRIKDRTPVLEKDDEDFRYWTFLQFEARIADLYLSSVSNKEALQKEPITNWEDILIQSDDDSSNYSSVIALTLNMESPGEQLNLQPTVFDLLAHRTIYFIRNHPVFLSDDQFEADIDTELLNELTSFHAKNKNEDAFLFNSLLKIEFSTEASSEEYMTRISELAEVYPKAGFTSYLLLQLARHSVRKADRAPEEDVEKKKKYFLEALALLEKIEKEFPDSFISSDARSLAGKIKNPVFSLQLEKFLVPGKPAPIAITHKNTDTIYFSVYHYEEFPENRKRDPKSEPPKVNERALVEEIIARSKKISEFRLDLKSFDDFQHHSTIAGIPPLEAGKYVLIASAGPDRNNYVFHILNVSPYALIIRNNELMVTDRESGKLVPGKKIRVFDGDYTENLLATLTTDENGIAYFRTARQVYRNFSFQIDDEIIRYQSNTSNPRKSNDEDRVRIAYFTDRKIYRPGQPVYFKIVAYSENNTGRKVLPSTPVEITLQTPNRTEVSSISLVTNEYGSAWGEFLLPAGGITGQFSLHNSPARSTYYFNVEEYKRPRFEVQFNPAEKLFKLNDTVSASGKAVSYSGAILNNSKVVYRVYRESVFWFRPWWERTTSPFERPEEIIHGETKTDSEGNFEIRFPAKPASERKKEPRVYNYRIEADITDISGETRSAEQVITVGDLRYLLEIPVKTRMNLADLDSIPVHTRNLNGEKTAAQGSIELLKLLPPDRVLRDSPFRIKTDYQLYTKEEFQSYFPNEPYDEENNKRYWERKTVFKKEFDTAESEVVSIDLKNPKEGFYLLRGMIFDGNDSISNEQLVYLYSNEKKIPADKEFFSIGFTENSYRPGDIAVLQIASATENSEVLVQLEADGEIVETRKIKIDNEVVNLEFPVKESYVGNVFLHYYFGKFNSVKSGIVTLAVSAEKSSLTITTKTMRSELTPGKNEIWEFTVSGTDKYKFSAEVLATMYDASLDQFLSNDIKFPDFSAVRSPFFESWRAYQSFYTASFLYHSEFYYPDFYGFPHDRDYKISYYTNKDILPYLWQINWFELFKEKIKDFRSYLSRAYSYPVRQTGAAPAPAYSAKDESIQTESIAEEKEPESAADPIVARRALQETAFFYPDLYTDKNGDIKIRFTVPESLTSWKFMMMAHTPDLRTGYLESMAQTRKDLMVIPNPPRFLRAGDQIVFSSRISNTSEKNLKGEVRLQLFDPFTMEPVDADFHNNQAVQRFEADAKSSVSASWHLQIPEEYQTVMYRIIASSGNFSDGEEAILPVLTNRTLVTETLPLHIRENQKKTVTLEKLKNNTSESLKNYKLTFELSSNPVWQAILSLPYLRQQPFRSSQQIFAHLYASLISEKILHSNPKIKTVFDNLNRQEYLKSPLELNPELKTILLEETPWIFNKESEEEQMRRIALLFDLNTLTNEVHATFEELKARQTPGGGFPWHEGGIDNFYITAHIVSGFGNLKQMGIDLVQLDYSGKYTISQAIRFLDRKMEDDFDKNEETTISFQHGIYYLYARSGFSEDFPLSEKGEKIRDYIFKNIRKYSADLDLQSQAMLALVLHRHGETRKAANLLTAIKERAVISEEMGMYWKSNTPGWSYYRTPIETQSKLIAAFEEILQDSESVENMKIWLLKNRQTNSWNSTKATTEAIFALLNTGKSWIESEKGITAVIGGKKLSPESLEVPPKSGSGYFKTGWNDSEIKPEMAEVTIEKTSPGIAWGALYWQYFEDLDKVTSAGAGLKFRKELFLKKNTRDGVVLKKISGENPIKTGDLVTVRLEIRTDRDMEFVHIKDMRASGLEPVEVLSTYKWKNGIGFYQAIRDASQHFFIENLPKGNYVFEYDLRASNAGEFSNGITEIESMYAPELRAHSKGIRIEIQQ